MHRIGKIHFDDPQSERGYNNWLAYGQSKLANLMFCFELDRARRRRGTALKSVAAHPGYAATNLQFAGPPKRLGADRDGRRQQVFAQSAEMGALPTLYAATVPDLPEARSWAPTGSWRSAGIRRVVTAAGKAYDEPDLGRLWELSERADRRDATSSRWAPRRDRPAH